LLQPLLQPQPGAAAQVGWAAAQVGAAAAQVGAAAPQLGAAAAQLLQPLLQQLLRQRFTLQQEVSQQLVSQPQPPAPSIRSSNSKPNDWVQTAMPSTNDPTKMFHFIERRLLNDGTIELAHAPVRPVGWFGLSR
jgi:hypothetical protein